MLDQTMEEALNKQVNRELFAGYLYLSAATYYQSVDLPGFANWMEVQYREEVTHAQRIYNYIHERGGRVRLQPIEGPPTDWENPGQPLEAAYGHEQKVTAWINDLMNMAIELRDHATVNFLQWFVEEQVEEEDNTSALVNRYKLAEGGNGLFMMDKELGARMYRPPSDKGWNVGSETAQ